MSYIDGGWVVEDAAPAFSRANPADTRDLIGRYRDADPEIGHLAALAAQRAYRAWANALPTDRARHLQQVATLLRERSAELARLLTREEGKPLDRALGEVGRAAEVFEYFAGAALRIQGATLPSIRPGVRLASVVEPVGPVLAITPFNFPLFVTALKLAAALVTGNTVVWKPSPHVPEISRALMAAFADTGLPDGVLNLVLGTSVELGRSLVADPIIQAISFTGSTAVGLEIGRGAAARHVRVQQEMGGKNLLVVAGDCDPLKAAEIACESSFGESGQKCTAAGIVLVDRAIADEFLAGVESVLGRWRLGPGLAGGDIAPLIDDRSLGRAEALIDRTVAQGGTVELRGSAVVPGSDLSHGHFLAPHVLTLPPAPSPLRDEESFAPIMPVIIGADPLSDALGLVEANGMGLSAAILTQRIDLALDFAHRVPAGLVNVNLPTTGVEYQAPFGGWNLSGGPFPEAGSAGLTFYTRHKTIAISPTL